MNLRVTRWLVPPILVGTMWLASWLGYILTGVKG